MTGALCETHRETATMCASCVRERLIALDCHYGEEVCTKDGDVSRYCLWHEAQRWRNAHGVQVKRKRTGTAKMRAHYEKRLAEQ